MARFSRGQWTNWAGNQTSHPYRIHRPNDEEQLGDIVRTAAAEGRTVKPVGTGHSFTATATTNGHLVRLDDMANLSNVDRAAGTITVGAGITIDALNNVLHGLGL
ncbi:MAG: hypothetical protein RL413_784, partial [Actinomycetota bacterium]